METDRRKSARIEVKWPVILENRISRIEGETLNISVEGISFCSEEPLRLQENYHIVIRPPNHPDVQISGKITWSDLYGMDEDKETFCMGVCFVQVSEEDEVFIEDVIADHLD